MIYGKIKLSTLCEKYRQELSDTNATTNMAHTKENDSSINSQGNHYSMQGIKYNNGGGIVAEQEQTPTMVIILHVNCVESMDTRSIIIGIAIMNPSNKLNKEYKKTLNQLNQEITKRVKP